MRSLLILCCLTSFIGAAAEEKLIYPLPPEGNVAVKSDVVYDAAAGQSLKFDLYRPRHVEDSRALPVIVFLNGIGAGWIRKHVQYTSWARLVTTADFAGVTMDSHSDAARSFDSLIAYLQSHAKQLGIGPDRVLVYACSSNVSAALPIVMDANRSYIKGAIIYYGAGEVSSFRRDLPVLFVRAGLDEPRLNHSIDALVARAYAENVPFTVINFSDGHHGFELRDDTLQSRNIIARTLEFARAEINPVAQADRRTHALEAAAAAALAAEKWDVAIDGYSQLSSKDPKNSEAHRKLAQALVGAGRFKEALDSYRRAFDLGSPNRGMIAFAAAVAAVKDGQPEQALDWIEKLKGIAVFRGRLLSEPAFKDIRDTARFRALIEQM